jgi:hypothetical protein
MKNSKSMLPVLAILLCVSLSCTFLKDKFANGGKSADAFSRIAKLPPLDPNAPMVSPGAVAVRELAKIDPAVADFARQIEANERAAMKRIIEANSESPMKEDTKPKAPPNRGAIAIPSVRPASPRQPAAAFMMFQAGDAPLPGINDGLIVGMLAGMFKSMFAEAPATNYHKKDSKTETSEGTTTTMDVEFGLGEDGSTSFGMGLKTEAMKNGIKVTTEMQSKVDGQDCPNAEGQIPITVKMRLSSRSGNAGVTQEVTAFIRLVVDDNAEIANGTIDVTQATSRGKNGQEVYVETGHTIKFRGPFEDSKTSNERVVQKTDNATDADIGDASNSGSNVAYGAAISVISMAKSAWQGGKCVKIEAKSPGNVGPGSGTEIPVKVKHKKDGSEVASKLDVTLVGEASIDPNVIAQTPGTLMYVAPAETGKTATIKLKATSRRGIATLDLVASTGTNSYRISGGLDEWYTDTVVCDITKPFTLTGTHGIQVKFSGGPSGTYEYSGTSFSAQGSGTYEMSFPYGEGKNGTMVGRGPGTVKGGGTTWKGSGEERYSLMAVDGACVDGPVKE